MASKHMIIVLTSSLLKRSCENFRFKKNEDIMICPILLRNTYFVEKFCLKKSVASVGISWDSSFELLDHLSV
jgi:hypothetical protein